MRTSPYQALRTEARQGPVKGGKHLIETRGSTCLELGYEVFLHDGKRGLYYADFDRWANKPEEGFDFGNIEDAMTANYQRGLLATEVVVISEKPAGVIRLSMDSSRLGA